MRKQLITEKYRSLRLAVMKQTQSEFEQLQPDLVDCISLTEINELALIAQKQWHPSLVRQIGWDWRKILQQYRRDHMARLELAIWHHQDLSGLMIGKASEGRLVVKINYIQGGDAVNPLKGYILPIASRCAELFAAAINAGWIGIQDPIENEDLLHYYHQLGFNQRDPFDPRNNALFKRIS
ncbi:hypothetical protein [Salinivibrio kushneri]|uniref:hypothetical protein n=1 Tax=Salinivibrio kushneri TaxID=1908198 RepID=UPI0009885C12|nr:hypothetical protein [Salinivibrio kushneri]OOE35007.1 hypothetical protein BZG04_09730 [Salinivibrio kushneri]OOE36945.1 hypothetical protein BZG05_01355 [Salinivibrio kushneri]OOE56440.1 hypothetical protein BZG12_01075 [Salinivibrio kushneri]